MENSKKVRFSLIEKFFKISPENYIWRLSYFLRQIIIFLLWILLAFLFSFFVFGDTTFVFFAHFYPTMFGIKMYEIAKFLSLFFLEISASYVFYIITMKRFQDFGESPKQLKYFYIFAWILALLAFIHKFFYLEDIYNNIISIREYNKLFIAWSINFCQFIFYLGFFLLFLECCLRESKK